VNQAVMQRRCDEHPVAAQFCGAGEILDAANPAADHERHVGHRAPYADKLAR
jgi:hypothetical protein